MFAMYRGVFYRGGNWNNAAEAGVFQANGNNERSNTNDNLGFRSALPHRISMTTYTVKCQMLQAHGPVSSTWGAKGPDPSV